MPTQERLLNNYTIIGKLLYMFYLKCYMIAIYLGCVLINMISKW